MRSVEDKPGVPGMADGAGPDSLPLPELDDPAAEALLLEDASIGNAARSLRARAPVDYKEPAVVRILITVTTHPHAPVPPSLRLAGDSLSPAVSHPP